MTFELDHFFVLTEPGAPLANRLTTAGLREGEPNTHPGQGTSNRRFFFSNSMLELLWLHDRAEAITGPGRRMNIAERTQSTDACPFGLIFRPKEKAQPTIPFRGWKYEPNYVNPPDYFHVAANSDILTEPLLIFAPFLIARYDLKAVGDNGRVNRVRIANPETEPSAEFSAATAAGNVNLLLGKPHLLEACCESQNLGTVDLRPELPLVIHR